MTGTPIGRYLLLEIGCLECAIDTTIVATYNDLDEATTAWRECEDRGHGTDIAYAVYDLAQPGEDAIEGGPPQAAWYRNKQREQQ